MGLAIGTFTPNSLTYVLYPVYWGSNDFILKKIKLNNFGDLDHSFDDSFLIAVIHETHNPIITNAPDIIMDHINKKIKEIIERKKFLFLTTEIAIEHIFDAIQENHRSWKIEQHDVIKLEELREFLEKNYSSRIFSQTIYYPSRISNPSTIYQCIVYLLKNNIQEINRVHPIMPQETDAMYPDYLFNKLKVVYSLLPPIFDAYMYYAFPSIRQKISFWKDFDLISINFMFQQNKYFIIFHYFKRLDNIKVQPQLIFTKNFSHELYKNHLFNGIYNHDYFKLSYTLNGINYKLNLIHGDDIHLIKRNFSIFNQLYNFLIRRFNECYFGRENQISPASLI